MKDSSSKTVCTATPLSAVTHNGGTLYTVKSASKEGVEYTVDLSIGMCDCVCGNTGSVCKHQLAASQHSAVRLPQVHTCTRDERQHLFKVMYGNKSMPSPSFFDGLFEETPVGGAGRDEKGACIQEGSSAETSVSGVAGVDGGSGAALEIDASSTDEIIDEFTSMLNKEFKRIRSTALLESFNGFGSKLKACRNGAQGSTLLRTAGCTLFQRTGAQKRKILCQPTSIARRSAGLPRGKSALLKGKVVKRRRNLAMNVQKNLPNAKIH